MALSDRAFILNKSEDFQAAVRAGGRKAIHAAETGLEISLRSTVYATTQALLSEGIADEGTIDQIVGIVLRGVVQDLAKS